jgi:hypothetical protein
MYISMSRIQLVLDISQTCNLCKRYISVCVCVHVCVCVCVHACVFSLRHRVHRSPYPMSTGDSFPGVSQPGRETDHSPQISANVKNKWSYTGATLTLRRHTCKILYYVIYYGN